MKFTGKWMELENILSEVTQSQKESIWYALTDKWTLTQKLRISKIQFTDHIKLKKKEGQIVDASVLLRRGNKITMGGSGREEPPRKEEREDWERKRRAVSGVRYDGGAGKRSTEGQVVLV